MIKGVLYLSLLFIIACEMDNEKNAQNMELIGKWQLIEIVSGWTNETRPASTLDYKEFYEFRPDSVVRKFRMPGEEALGTYTLEEKPDGTYIKIIFNEPNTDLKETCGEHEFLRWVEGKLHGGSLPCDGPGLNYEKVTSAND